MQTAQADLADRNFEISCLAVAGVAFVYSQPSSCHHPGSLPAPGSSAAETGFVPCTLPYNRLLLPFHELGKTLQGTWLALLL